MQKKWITSQGTKFRSYLQRNILWWLVFKFFLCGLRDFCFVCLIGFGGFFGFLRGVCVGIWVECGE